MFGFFRFFKKKKPRHALDKFIFAIYGNPPPPKRADCQQAVTLANELLTGVIELQDIHRKATELHDGLIPYSTHDLALCVALSFFMEPQHVPHLSGAQLLARLKVLQWYEAGLVVQPFLKSFEDTLYKLYKPGL